MAKYQKGQIIKGIVSGIENYGIFLKIDDSYSGLIHISEISDGYIRNIGDYAKIGDGIYAEILEIDNKNYQIRLSIKNIYYKSGLKIEKRKIIETKHGFNTLARYLPYWIDENIKKHKKHSNCIDKRIV